ncbi:hypothetical protein LguiA_007051 [Lonicera macranthoides]
MEESMPENPIDRVDAWLAGHQKEDGTVLPSAKPLYDQVKEIKTKRKGGEDGSSSTIENDGLTHVFGKDIKGRLRGVGSHISKKQMVIVEIEKAKGVAKNKEKTKDDAFKDEVMASMQSQIQTINADFKSDLMLSMQNLLQSFMNSAKESSPPVVGTPRSDLGSNSVHHPPNIIQNLDNCFDGASRPLSSPNPSNKPSVILLDKYYKELAVGHVVTDASARICHGKEVSPCEKKVWIEEVIEPDAALWDAPQDGHHTLSAYVSGGYLVWLDSLLKYL